MAVEKKDAEGFLTIDYNNLTAEVVGPGGLTPEDLASLKEPLAAAVKDLTSRYRQGLLPFLDLPKDAKLAKQCQKLAQSGREKYTDILVLGIGGSALGSTAIYSALQPLASRSAKGKKGYPRLIVADNIDPEGFATHLETLDPQTTLVNVISKSGATAETMSQFMILFDWLKKKGGKNALTENLLVTTDPTSGVLRQIADDLDLVTLPIPPGVGGRFSVLTAVGLAPLALAGVNIEGLLAGAEVAASDGLKNSPSNKAALFAGLNWLLTTQKNRDNLIFIPYSDALAKVADWFIQLWNESLGKGLKLDGSENLLAQTAAKALGATDQHSQLQMWMEGPANKTVLFLGVDKLRTDLKIPAIFKEHEALAYLGGQTLGQLLSYEQKGTARALAENHRPNLTLTLPTISPQTVGYLLQTLEIATVISGTLYGVDPLDQPGVELGKKFTYGLMGREGFSDYFKRYEQGRSAKKKYIVQ